MQILQRFVYSLIDSFGLSSVLYDDLVSFYSMFVAIEGLSSCILIFEFCSMFYKMC